MDARRIDEPEAADPHVVLGTRRKGRQQIATLVVGDHDLGITRGTQAGRFRDDPHAGFRSLAPGHHPSDIGRPNPDRLGANLAGPSRQARGDDDCCRARVRGSCRTHANPPRRNQQWPPGTLLYAETLRRGRSRWAGLTASPPHLRASLENLCCRDDLRRVTLRVLGGMKEQSEHG